MKKQRLKLFEPHIVCSRPIKAMQNNFLCSYSKTVTLDLISHRTAYCSKYDFDKDVFDATKAAILCPLPRKRPSKSALSKIS